MNKNQVAILKSELTISYKYFERILHCLFDLLDQSSNEKIIQDLNGLNQEIKNILSIYLFKGTFDQQSDRNLRQKFVMYFESLNKLMEIGLSHQDLVTPITEVVNAMYRSSFFLHKDFILDSQFEVQLPVITLADTIELSLEEQENKTIPKYFLKTEKLMDALTDDLNLIEVLDWKRNDLYEKNYQLAFQALSSENFQMALNHFEKALKYKTTGEILTLIGWCYSKLGKMEHAKSFCLKSIKFDANYGAAYNDFGTYIYQEGEVKDSIKWFELAKLAANYTNREFPYINAGRAHLSLGNPEKAIQEFEKALEIAPHNAELKLILEKINKTLSRSSQKNLDNEFFGGYN